MNSHVSTSGTTTRWPDCLATRHDVFASDAFDSRILANSGSNPRQVSRRRASWFSIDHLQARHVGAHDGDGRVENPLVERARHPLRGSVEG